MTKLYMLFLCGVLVTAMSLLAAVAAETETETAKSVSDKEELASVLLFEERHAEDPAEKSALLRRVADECAGTEPAQEALWKLSRLYLDGFDEPNTAEAIACLERFVTSYPDSGWRPNAEFSLLGLYESEKLWDKAGALREKLLAENGDMPERLRGELRKRGKK